MSYTANSMNIALDDGDQGNDNPPNNNPQNDNPPNNIPLQNPPPNPNRTRRNVFVGDRNPRNASPERRRLFRVMGVNILEPIGQVNVPPRRADFRIGMRAPQLPAQLPQPPQQNAQLPDVALAYKNALVGIQALKLQAGLIAAKSPTQTELRKAIALTRGEMRVAATQEDFPTALKRLRELEKLYDQLVQSDGVLQSLAVKQQGRLDEMSEALHGVRQGYFNNPMSGSLGIEQSIKTARAEDDGFRPDKIFLIYLDALKNVEFLQSVRKTMEPADHAGKMREAAGMLVKVAQAYLNHYEKDLAREQTPSKTDLRNKQVCESGLVMARQLLLTAEIDSLGQPTDKKPWSDVKNLKFNWLRSQFYFETGYTKASRLQGGGQSGAFWIESTSFKPPPPKKPQQTEESDSKEERETDELESNEGLEQIRPDTGPEKEQIKRFLFKPSDLAETVFSYDRNCPGLAVAKESLAFSTAKLIREQSGLDFGVPETSVASLPGETIEGRQASPVIGSLQEFESSRGELRVLDDLRAQVVPSEWQKVAINDIIQLNCDRHAGNFLVQEGGGPQGTPKLVPIDHGNTLPTVDDFLRQANEIGGMANGKVKNTTLESPGAYEPFTIEMLDAIDRIDPSAIRKNMREHAKALDDVNPGFHVSESLPEDALILSERTTFFMKLAAKSLSPAEIFIAINRYKKLFANFDLEVEDFAREIIDELRPQKKQLQKILTAPLGIRQTLGNQLSLLGWEASLLIDKPDLASKLLAGWIQKQSTEQLPEQAVEGFDPTAIMTQRIPDLFKSFRKVHMKAIEKLEEIAGDLPANVKKALADEQIVLQLQPANETEAFDILMRVLADIRVCQEEVPGAYYAYVKNLYEQRKFGLKTGENEIFEKSLEEFKSLAGALQPRTCGDAYDRFEKSLENLAKN